MRGPIDLIIEPSGLKKQHPVSGEGRPPDLHYYSPALLFFMRSANS